MADLNLTIVASPNKARRIKVEFDADRLERLAANLGLFSPEFRQSLADAERDIRSGKTRPISSLRDLANA